MTWCGGLRPPGDGDARLADECIPDVTRPRDPSVRHALDAILSRVRVAPADSEEAEARRAVAALVP